MLIKEQTKKNLNIALILISYICCFVYGVNGTARGIIYPDLLKEFHLSNTEGSLFFSLASVFGLANNLLTFKWYPRLGPLKAMSLFSAMFAISIFIIAFAPNFMITLIGSSILGFSMGGTGLLCNTLAVESTSDLSLRRQILSGLHAFYGIGSCLSPLIVNVLVQFGFDWRMTFAIMGIVPVLATLQAIQTKSESLSHEWKSAFVDHKPWRRTLWYASFCTLYVATETLLSTRLVLYGRSVLNYEIEPAGFLLSSFFLTFTFGRVSFALIRLKHSNFAILMSSAILSVIAFLIGLYVHPIGFALCGLGCSVFYPCAMSLLSGELGQATAFTMSWCQTAQSLGAILMHSSVGYLADRVGLQNAMLVGPVLLVIMIGVLIWGFPKPDGLLRRLEA